MIQEQRAKRIEQVKATFLSMVRRDHPELRPDAQVEISPDAAIDLFGLGILDLPEPEWQEFLEDLAKAEPCEDGD